MLHRRRYISVITPESDIRGVKTSMRCVTAIIVTSHAMPQCANVITMNVPCRRHKPLPASNRRVVMNCNRSAAMHRESLRYRLFRNRVTLQHSNKAVHRRVMQNGVSAAIVALASGARNNQSRASLLCRTRSQYNDRVKNCSVTHQPRRRLRCSNPGCSPSDSKLTCSNGRRCAMKRIAAHITSRGCGRTGNGSHRGAVTINNEAKVSAVVDRYV